MFTTTKAPIIQPQERASIPTTTVASTDSTPERPPTGYKELLQIVTTYQEAYANLVSKGTPPKAFEVLQQIRDQGTTDPRLTYRLQAFAHILQGLNIVDIASTPQTTLIDHQEELFKVIKKRDIGSLTQLLRTHSTYQSIEKFIQDVLYNQEVALIPGWTATTLRDYFNQQLTNLQNENPSEELKRWQQELERADIFQPFDSQKLIEQDNGKRVINAIALASILQGINTRRTGDQNQYIPEVVISLVMIALTDPKQEAQIPKLGQPPDQVIKMIRDKDSPSQQFMRHLINILPSEQNIGQKTQFIIHKLSPFIKKYWPKTVDQSTPPTASQPPRQPSVARRVLQPLPSLA